MAEVQIRSVSKNFGATSVLENASLTVDEGEFVSLIGPSGCGKSTLLRIISGLELQDTGQIVIGDKIVDDLRPSARNLAMVFQSYALYPHLNVASNIAMPLRMQQLNSFQRLPVIGRFLPGTTAANDGIAQQVRDAAEMLDISHLLERKPGQLSGGQRQRVAVGRALVRNPAAFLLDEPLSNLDAKLRVHMRTEIAQLHRRLKATFIYVTHDQVEAMTMSDRIAVMMDGDIIQTGTPDEVYDAPVDIRVAEFIGSPKINIIPVEIEAARGVALLAGVASGVAADTTAVCLGVRPEAIKISPTDGLAAGIVEHAENLGSEEYVQVRLDALPEVVITARAGHGAGWTRHIGSAAHISFDCDRALAFNAVGKRVSCHAYAPRRSSGKAVANG
ncbi:MAG: ABC transporter ATP-binding protein [Pseudomonadota bacterium]